MNIEKTIPFSWNAWDQQDVLHNTYYNVEFLEDFGPFKKGEKFTSIDVNYGEGFIEAYDDKGENVIKCVKYKSIPVNE
jgi:hypothetical protein